MAGAVAAASADGTRQIAGTYGARFALQPLARPHLFTKSVFIVAVSQALAVVGAVVAASADETRRLAGTYGACCTLQPLTLLHLFPKSAFNVNGRPVSEGSLGRGWRFFVSSSFECSVNLFQGWGSRR